MQGFMVSLFAVIVSLLASCGWNWYEFTFFVEMSDNGGFSHLGSVNNVYRKKENTSVINMRVYNRSELLKYRNSSYSGMHDNSLCDCNVKSLIP